MSNKNPLTCIKLSKDNINFTTLIDGGSNASVVTEGLVKAMKLSHLINYEKVKVKSWNDKECFFKGTINLSFYIGIHRFHHHFYIASKLETGTVGILGIDFLKKAEATVTYGKNEVKLTFKQGKLEIPLVKASTKFFRSNVLQIYSVKEDIKKVNLMARICETSKIQPLLGKMVRIVLPDQDWPKQAHLEAGEPKPGILIDPQIISVNKYKPHLKAKHSIHCQSIKCIESCPTKSYYFAYAFIYNSSSEAVYLHIDSKVTPVESVWDNSLLKQTFNKALNTAFVDINRFKENEFGKENIVEESNFGKEHISEKLNFFDKTKNSEDLVSHEDTPVFFNNLQVNKKICRKPTCKFHQDISLNEKSNLPTGTSNGLQSNFNYLHLDPIEDKQKYSKAYNERHDPKINLEDRTEEVKKLINEKYADMHPLAKQYLLKYPEVVNLQGVQFVGCRTLKHKIIYKGPIFFQKQYRTPQVLESQILEEIDRLIKEGLIEPSDSPFSNCYLPVVKFDKATQKYKIRLCLDLRKLNAGIDIDRLPIGDTQDLLNKMHGTRYLTVLDASSGYLQVDLDHDSRKFTAFRVGNRGYQFKKMCFGLGSAPSSWSRLMQVTLSGLSSVFVYMDDILIFTNSLEEHARVLEQVFQRLSFHGIEIALRKCKFVSKEVEYLGFLFTADGLKPQEKRVQAFLDIGLPKTLTEARSLISTFSFYRRFIKNFSKIAEPLIKLTKGHQIIKGKKISVVPDQKCAEALEKLKNIIKERVCLKYPDFSVPFVITSDASYTGLGAVLSQNDEKGNQRPLAFASRTLTLSETRYPVVELECLGIIFALKQFRHIVLGYQIELITDHLPLVYLFKHADPSSRLYRYQLALLEYNIIGLHHLAGKENKVCDYLSRWSFQEDSDLGPVVSFALTSPLSAALPPEFDYERQEHLTNNQPNSLIIFTADSRNFKYSNYVNSLINHQPQIDDFYKGRIEIGEGVATLESCPKLGQILYNEHANTHFAMCITNLFQKPVTTLERQKLANFILSNEVLNSEGFKFMLRNDKTAIRDYYFMVCLEQIINNYNFKNISRVVVIWPQVFDENNKRIRHVQDILKKFAFALWQKDIPCAIINNPEINYKDKDAMIATMKVIEAQALPITLFKFETDQLYQEQLKDPFLLNIFEQMKEKSEICNLEYSIINNILHKIECDKSRGIVHKVCIPASFVTSIIKMYHDDNSHPGLAKTIGNCRSQCHWPNMNKDISKYISHCLICVRAKISNNRQVLPGNLLTPPQPGNTWAIDILGSIPKSGYYNKVLVVICTFSRFTWAYPLVAGSATEVIKNLEDLFHRYGPGEVLVSDRAGAFTGKEFENYLKFRNLHHHLTTPYSPRSNALAERSIRNVLDILRVLCEDKSNSWSSYLATVCGAINEGFNTSIKERPYFLFFGRDPVPLSGILRDKMSVCDSNELYQITKYAYELAANEINKLQERRKEKCTAGRVNTYDVGDIVYLQRNSVGDKAYKLRYPYDGPYRVFEIAGNTVVLKSLANNKIRKASMRDIKIFKGSVLSKSDNGNVDRAFPIYQEIPTDESPVDQKQTKPYNLRARK